MQRRSRVVAREKLAIQPREKALSLLLPVSGMTGVAAAAASASVVAVAASTKSETSRSLFH
jgi:hypothetical protein